MVSLSSLLIVAALSAPGETVLLDFTSTTCGPCKMMEPSLHRLAEAGYPIRKIDVMQQPQLASQYGVRGVPCFVMLANGQEVDRVVGATSMGRLQQMFQAARFAPGVPQSQPQVRLQSPDAAGRGSEGHRQQAPPVMAGNRFGDASPATQEQSIPWSQRPPAHQFAQQNAAPGSSSSSVGRQRMTAQQRAMTASVRLRVDDPGGHSYGSGTIVDLHGEEALVVTCAHIFRDSDGKGKISADLFLPEGRRVVTGALIRYDMKRDVALVSIRPGVKLDAMKVAGANYAPRVGERVFSVGCDRGGQPSLQESRVTGVNKLLGPPNIHVAGQPVDGRSGGGLFTADGQLIGICNFADPTDNAGIFAAYKSLHSLLDQAGLSFVYQGGPSAEEQFAAVPEDRGPSNSVAASPASFSSPAAPTNRSGDSQQLSAEERAVLSRLAGKSEVVCIVNDPRGGSRVVKIDTPSSSFFEHLTAESQRQASRQATTMHLNNYTSNAARDDSWRTPRPR